MDDVNEYNYLVIFKMHETIVTIFIANWKKQKQSKTTTI